MIFNRAPEDFLSKQNLIQPNNVKGYNKETQIWKQLEIQMRRDIVNMFRIDFQKFWNLNTIQKNKQVQEFTISEFESKPVVQEPQRLQTFQTKQLKPTNQKTTLYEINRKLQQNSQNKLQTYPKLQSLQYSNKTSIQMQPIDNKNVQQSKKSLDTIKIQQTQNQIPQQQQFSTIINQQSSTIQQQEEDKQFIKLNKNILIWNKLILFKGIHQYV